MKRVTDVLVFKLVGGVSKNPLHYMAIYACAFSLTNDKVRPMPRSLLLHLVWSVRLYHPGWCLVGLNTVPSLTQRMLPVSFGYLF